MQLATGDFIALCSRMTAIRTKDRQSVMLMAQSVRNVKNGIARYLE
jgi:hypothetical protein